jgi:hypothetical protein
MLTSPGMQRVDELFADIPPALRRWRPVAGERTRCPD